MQEARDHLQQYLLDKPLLKDAYVTRLANLDAGDYFGFYLMPKTTGRAGEVFFLTDGKEVLSSGKPDSFNRIIKHLFNKGIVPGITKLATLFLRLKALRNGEILDNTNTDLVTFQRTGTALPAPPSFYQKSEAFVYEFWLFDTDHRLPVFFSIAISKTREVSHLTKEIANDGGLLLNAFYII